VCNICSVSKCSVTAGKFFERTYQLVKEVTSLFILEFGYKFVAKYLETAIITTHQLLAFYI
jgi:hypothetical protein